MIVVYNASNTTQQVIDTFDPAVVKRLHYSVNVEDSLARTTCDLDVTHNGINVTEVQTGSATNNIRPAEIVVDVVNGVGRVLTTPLKAPARYTLVRTDVAANLYSEHTLSGRKIPADEGVGIYFASPANMTVRQEDNNSFGNASVWMSANTLGPILSLDELANTESFVSYNYSDLSHQDDYILIASSGQLRNCQYLEIPVVAGERYSFTANVLYTAVDIPQRVEHDNQQGLPSVHIGDMVAGAEYLSYVATPSEQTCTVAFTPATNTVFISLGFGELGMTLQARGITLRRSVPFHTYSQNDGTIFVRWNAVAAPATILSFVSSISNNTVAVDSSNNITVNGIVCQPQAANNLLALRYSNSQIGYSFNGSAVANTGGRFVNDVRRLDFGSGIVEFTYSPVQSDDNTLTGLTNG